MERDYSKLAERYEQIRAIENEVERAANFQMVNLELKLGAAEDRLEEARINVLHSVQNKSDAESIEGWMRNLKNAEQSLALIRAQTEIISMILNKVG
jgi:hypothetical protein